jgi:hypothetical protein
MEDNVSVDVAEWLTAVDRHAETIGTDRWVAMELAQFPERLWGQPPDGEAPRRSRRDRQLPGDSR